MGIHVLQRLSSQDILQHQSCLLGENTCVSCRLLAMECSLPSLLDDEKNILKTES